MHHAELTEAIRRRVVERFAQLGVNQDTVLRESILIRDGAYCGRRFEAAGAHAIWFLEEDQLKFYRADGGALCVLSPAVEEPRAARLAA